MKMLVLLFTLSGLAITWPQRVPAHEYYTKLTMDLNELCPDCSTCEYHHYASATYTGQLKTEHDPEEGGKISFSFTHGDTLQGAPKKHADGTCYWPHDGESVFNLEPGEWKVSVKDGDSHTCDITLNVGDNRVLLGVGGCDYSPPR